MSDLIKVVHRDDPGAEVDRLTKLLFPEQNEPRIYYAGVQIGAIWDGESWHSRFIGLHLYYRNVTGRTNSRFVRVKDDQIDLDEVRQKHQELLAGALKADAAEQAGETEKRRVLTKLRALTLELSLNLSEHLVIASTPGLYNLALCGLDEAQVRLVLQALRSQGDSKG